MKNLAMFKDTVDLYSADLSRGPADLVKPALALMETSAEAKEYFDEALKLDAALRTLGAREKSYDALEAKIMQQVSSMTQVKTAPSVSGIFGFPIKPAQIFAPGGGILAVVLIALFINFQPPTPLPHMNYSPIDAVVFSDELIPADDDVDELFDEYVY